ncbi:DUF1064 domain-containing protein [Burkholderia gladioli]|uniref:DUF1064 domain-containing protein n=1 Tax=Burkholderia gladioli TaxID=28095 RepID=UPI00163E98F1|nr:DUF1064 domain-containing protein [Burkholderia gladioli]
MTKRSAWPMRIDAGTTRVGTATIRDDSRPAMTTAQRRIYEATGNRPQADSGFDEIADGLDPFAPQALGAPAPAKQPKYRNSKCEHEGVKFDSRKERSRWFHLIQLQAAREIRDLQLQVAYVLIERRQRDDGIWERATKYVADFVYTDVATGKTVVEDVKSPATRKNPTYVLKRKLMLDRHGITIKEL